MEKGTKAKRVLNHHTKSSANIAKLTTAKKLVKKITNIAKKNGRDRERQNLQRHKEPSARLKFSKYSKGSEKLICNFFFLSFFFNNIYLLLQNIYNSNYTNYTIHRYKEMIK